VGRGLFFKRHHSLAKRGEICFVELGGS